MVRKWEKQKVNLSRVKDYFLNYLRMIQDPDNQHYKLSKRAQYPRVEKERKCTCSGGDSILYCPIHGR